MSDIEQIVKKNEAECKDSIAAFKRELQKVRSGRASSAVLEGVMVDYYGSRTPLKSLAQISTPEPRTVVIQVFDASAVESIQKAIMSSELGLNPSRDGSILRVTFPPLTQEVRRDIVKVLHKSAEDVRVSIRNHRRDANDGLKKLEKDSSATKDEVKRTMDRIQKVTDSSIKEVDNLLAAKEAEVMEV